MLHNQRLELARQRAVATRIQVLVDSLLQTSEPLVLEARDLRLCEAVIREVTERGPAPQRERLGEPSLLSKPLKTAEIQLVVGNAEQVARGSGLQPLLPQQLAKAGNVDLQRLVGRLRRIA